MNDVCECVCVEGGGGGGSPSPPPPSCILQKCANNKEIRSFMDQMKNENRSNCPIPKYQCIKKIPTN